MDYRARFYSPSLGRFIQPDTVIPNINNPQNFNRFTYVLNNPTNHVDPTGHQLVQAAEALFFVAVAIVVTTFVVEYTSPQMLDQMEETRHEFVESTTSVIETASQYISKTVQDRYEALQNQIANTNSGKNYPTNPCASSTEAMVYCITGGVVTAGLLLYAWAKGGCDEPESNSTCPPKPTFTPSITPTSTPGCPPYIKCPNTPSSPPTHTPTLKPTPTPQSTPTPPIIPGPSNRKVMMPI